MGQSAELTPEDFVTKTIGSVMYIYYVYLDRYKTRPKDLEDLVDGLLFIKAEGYQEKTAMEAAQRKYTKHG